MISQNRPWCNLKCKHLKTHFMQFCNCKNEICRCDDVNIYGRLKVRFPELKRSTF